MENALKTPVTQLHGVGKVRAAAYERLGIKTVFHLLFHFPRAYENRGDIRMLAAVPEEGKCAFILTVASEPKCFTLHRGMVLCRFRAFDDSGTALVTFFNQPYLKNAFHVGETFRFFGRAERTGKSFSLSNPVFERWDEAHPLPGLYPVYPMTRDLSGKQIAQNIAEALTYRGDADRDTLPADLREKYRLCTLSAALSYIHAPASFEELAVAKRRLIFEEFFLFALGSAVACRRVRTGRAPMCPDSDLTPFLSTLPYTLTGAQKRAIDQILSDMGRETPMRRIVVGDVGCGKTVCAAAAMYIAVKNGRQAALMAPTEILARQHFADLSAQLAPLGIRVALLVGAMTPAQKRAVYGGLTAKEAKNRVDIVIGTHALLSEGVSFAAPGLVITDEQHRFGAAQRAILSGKSGDTHMLVMSATPIPRSMALMLYGDLDVCRIDEMPPGRQPVDTYVVGEGYRARLDAFILKNVAEGGQVYVVCPAVEDADEADKPDGGEIDFDAALAGQRTPDDRPPLRSAVTTARELEERLPTLRGKIAFLHGRMKSAEKDDIMRRFAAGEVAVLVSTTVIEVGVNVPNASLMIIENADRFGLSQLHQLRGRVGRGKRRSYCVLVSDARGETARARLATMRDTHDGYRIAEEDLKQRGPGDFFRGIRGESIRQSGELHFRLADLCDDAGLLSDATAAAHAILDIDPTLTRYPTLRDAVAEMFDVESGTLS